MRGSMVGEGCFSAALVFLDLPPFCKSGPADGGWAEEEGVGRAVESAVDE